MATVVGVPSRVKRLRMAARTCSSATWRSKSRAITRSPSSLKQRILVSTRLRRWYRSVAGIAARYTGTGGSSGTLS